MNTLKVSDKRFVPYIEIRGSCKRGYKKMFDTIDWKLVSFVSYTMLHEYIMYIRMPQIYYWETAKQEALKK
jgi:hypothetical protein